MVDETKILADDPREPDPPAENPEMILPAHEGITPEVEDRDQVDEMLADD